MPTSSFFVENQKQNYYVAWVGVGTVDPIRGDCDFRVIINTELDSLTVGTVDPIRGDCD